MTDQPAEPQRETLLDAILPHVAFDGWSPAAWEAALADSGVAPEVARALCPRGAVDLAVAFHRRGDAAMRADLAACDLSALRYSDKVATAVMRRLALVDDKEAVRRGTTLFALPHMAPTGAGLIWGTADAIWEALGDTAQDGNWYSKRLILSGVYSSAVLFWLGDDSPDATATKGFIDRRIADVMRFETLKSQARSNPLTKPMAAMLGRVMAGIRAPRSTPPSDLPGIWRP